MPKIERASTFNTGIAAEYFILSQLYRQGIEAYISQGNKKAIDIRVIKKDATTFSLDVKAVRDYASFPINNVKAMKNHFIVFVSYSKKFEDLDQLPKVFIVPSEYVIKIRKCFGKNKDQYRITSLKDIEKYKNNWNLECY